MFPGPVFLLAALLVTVHFNAGLACSQALAAEDWADAQQVSRSDRPDTSSGAQAVPSVQETAPPAQVSPDAQLKPPSATRAPSDANDAPPAEPQASPDAQQTPPASQAPANLSPEFADILTPKTSDLFSSRGLVRYRVGDIKGALTDFDKAIELDNSNAEAFCGRGYLKLYLGENQSALSDFDKAIAINPKNTDAYCGRGQVRSELGQEKAAAEDFDYAIKLDPKNAPSYIFRGYHLNRYGETFRAIADYDQTIRLDPTNTLAYSYRASARGAVKDNKGAIADFNTVLKFAPQDAWAFYWRGHARREVGDRKGAVSDYNEYIRLKPDDPWGFRGRGFVRQVSGERKNAIQDYTKAIALDPSDAWTFSARGFVRQKLGDTRGSIADYRQAAKLEKLKAQASRQTTSAGTETKSAEAETKSAANETKSDSSQTEPVVELLNNPDVYTFSEKTLTEAQQNFGKPIVPIKQLLIFRRPGPHCQTVMWDSDKGIFCIFMANEVNDNYFQGNLGHELVHLLNAKLCDPYIEGLCTVFGEAKIPEQDPKRVAYRELVLSTPFYSETYRMMKELKGKIDKNSFDSIMKFAAFDPQKQWMHIEVTKWLNSMPESDRQNAVAVIQNYADGIQRTMPKDGVYVFQRPNMKSAKTEAAE
jgi:tetratricopeptide (TPR) repeat protein